ncbi:hypothetical protein ILUMI_22756 [Ignelater luminosus]|uniref:RRM domain-containing protein n=1 Tax=Ignelater luminosus TaxID=2038154 RepID=A0A8K0G088_IGNLU|nr:hypothetical protein ILUMI_22756 [Ignelater luminosus]
MVSLNNMYPDTMNFQIEEQLPSFDLGFNMSDNFGSDLIAQHQWDWDLEKVINGDVAVIPSCSEVASMQYDSSSPPATMDCYKLNGDWHNLMSMDVLDIENAPILEQEEKLVNTIPDLLVENDTKPPRNVTKQPENDIKQEENDIKPPFTAPVFPKKFVSAGKKIDMDAQCYIIDDQRISPKVEYLDSEDDSDTDESDTETTNTSSCDMQPSEVQSENNEENEVINQPDKKENNDKLNDNSNKLFNHDDNLENEIVDVISLSNDDLVLLAGDVDSLLEQFEAAPELSTNIEQTKQNEYYSAEVVKNSNCEDPRKNSSFYANCFSEQKPQIKDNLKESQPQISIKPQVSVESHSQSNLHKKSNHRQSNESTKSKEILNYLPAELVKKIRSGNKRKLIPLIDPVPNKRRAIVKKQSEAAILNAIKLDHSYSSSSSQEQWKKVEKHPKIVIPVSYPKCPNNKDLGFHTDEGNLQTQVNLLAYINERTVLKSNIIKRQINSANVKQGVSVLKSKVNEINVAPSPSTSSGPSSLNGMSIQSANSVRDNSRKKKKLNLAEYKKRRDLPRSGGSSLNASPAGSGPCSPAATKDEQDRYQRMLMEVLRATPKSAVPIPSTAQPEKPAPTAATQLEGVAAPPSMPPHLERKEYVSIGVNTDGAGLSLKHLTVPLKELEEIRPILENASDKISNNSLIASVIENVKNKKIKHKLGQNELDKRLPEHHGEDKVIMWPEKNRPKKPTKDACVQTEAIVEPENINHRRTRDSGSSSSETRKRRRRSTSRESHYSYSSQSSPSSYTSSRSYSPTPRSRRRYNEVDEEHLRAVYERRIVYVGGIGSSMTTDGLRRRFHGFGQIIDVRLHFPSHRDSYGFLTFAKREDAYRAVEMGNDDPSLPRYELNFGGRRIFCDQEYADLDNVRDDMIYASPVQDTSFDHLLEETQAILTRKRKCT